MRRLEREYHVRAFGEELAKVNLDFTIEERLSYIDWMRKTVRHGSRPSEHSAAAERERMERKIADGVS